MKKEETFHFVVGYIFLKGARISAKVKLGWRRVQLTRYM
jgi:hypothetical protein